MIFPLIGLVWNFCKISNYLAKLFNQRLKLTCLLVGSLLTELQFFALAFALICSKISRICFCTSSPNLRRSCNHRLWDSVNPNQPIQFDDLPDKNRCCICRQSRTFAYKGRDDQIDYHARNDKIMQELLETLFSIYIIYWLSTYALIVYLFAPTGQQFS